MTINKKYTESLKDFLGAAIHSLADEFADGNANNDDDIRFYPRMIHIGAEVHDKIVEGQDVSVTVKEAQCLVDIIEYAFLDMIRDDRDIDNLPWAYNILHVWKQCSNAK